MMYKSQIWKIDPYDWFCAPGSHILIKGLVFICIIFVSVRFNFRINECNAI